MDDHDETPAPSSASPGAVPPSRGPTEPAASSPGRVTAPEDDFPAGRWRARWIWADPATARGGEPPGRHAVALRRVVHLDAVPHRVPARMVAIARYALWVNGVEVARGPVRANPRRQPYDHVDLAPRLRAGPNVLAAVAWRYAGPMPWWLPPPPLANDLGWGAFVFEARLGADRWLVSDATWQATVLDGWTATAGGGVSGRGRELIDARPLPAGWDRPASAARGGTAAGGAATAAAGTGDAGEPGPALGWPQAIERRAMTTGESGRPEPPSYPLGPLGPRPTTAPHVEDLEVPPCGIIAGTPLLRPPTGAGPQQGDDLDYFDLGLDDDDLDLDRDEPEEQVDLALDQEDQPDPDPPDEVGVDVEDDDDPDDLGLEEDDGSGDLDAAVATPPGTTLHVVLGDRVVVGTVEIDVEGPAGAVVVVRPAEMVDDEGRPAPGEHDATVAFTTDGTRRRIESCDLYGLRGALVAVPAGVTVHGVTVRQRLHPVTGEASFSCSDPRLERIWRVGRRTVSICSLDAYVDCPTREQRAWTGDAVVHQMVDLTTNADWTLARWYPRLAASPRPDGMLPMAVAGDIEAVDFTVIPDWALHWVHAVTNLARYTGDHDEVAALLPTVEGVLRWFTPFCDGDGLPTDVTGWVFVDWASVATEGVCAALCGLWGRGLLELAAMSEWLGDQGRAGWAWHTHERLRAGFDRLWDPARGRYVDSLVPGGPWRPAASQHGQAAALVGGLAPPDRHARLVEVLTDEEALVDAAFSVPDGPAIPGSEAPVGGDHLGRGHPAPWWDVERQVVRAQPFFRYVVHDALVAAGRADLIAGACLDWTVALERCPTSLTETWYGGTVSHGWSSTPTRDLMTRVLGVEPAEWGFGVARVDPALGALTRAAGAVPCPGGHVHVTARPGAVEVDSPIPFVHRGVRHPAGHHRFRDPDR